MSRHWSYGLLGLLALGAFGGYGCGRSALAAGDATEPRSDVALTVFKQDFCMVREVRKLDLSQGQNEVQLGDVSRLVDQDTVMFDWRDQKGLTLVSSAYDLGVSDSSQVLSRFLGREVELVRYGENGREAERIRGILEVADPGNLVLKVDGEYLINPEGTIVTSASGGGVLLPKLTAEVESDGAKNANLDLSYLTRGLSWNADYVMRMRKDGTVDLECWATVDNQTGANYPNAQIKFVAGNPNRAALASAKRGTTLSHEADHYFERHSGAGGAAMEAIATGELYSYAAEKKATVRADRKSRIKMFAKEGLTVTKDYNLRLDGSYGYYYRRPDQDQRIQATLAVWFTNDEGAGLGMPLPQGALRAYEPDKSGAQTYIGAANVGDTPKDAKVHATLTEVFDVYADLKPVKQQKVGKKWHHTYEAVLHNEKATPVQLRVVRSVWGKVVRESHKGEKTTANEYQWKIDIPAGGEVKLSFVLEN